MHLIIHLSGGAFEDKLGNDILKPLGLSANIYDPFKPRAIMQKCATWRGMNSEECYRTWNGGQGALVVVDSRDADNFLALCKIFQIEGKIAGKINKKKEYTVAINTGFNDGKAVFYY
jgi:phosphoribosylaminoimidazole (AIR) synthetase